MGNPMESIIISTLSSSFKQVPASAIPPMLDCVLASTGFPPSSLFTSLLDSFLSQDVVTPREDQNLDYSHRNYVTSSVAALCHLLKKLGNASDGMQSFIWRCFIPLIKNAHMLESGIINQVAESFFDVVIKINCWDVLGATVVPFFIKAIGLSVGMIQNDETGVFKWDQPLCLQGLDSTTCDTDLDIHSNMSLSGPFPLPVSCHVLTLVLDAALHSFQETSSSTAQSALGNGYSIVQKLFVNLLWDLCNMSERLLLQSSEHRSCAINFLLPVIFTTLVSQCSLEVSVRGCKWKLSSDLFSRKIWKCCRTLFSLGSLERKDAYRTLSLFLSFFSCVNQCEGAEGIANAENFDVRAEREFWDELKRGLVDDERLVRKQSLHALKAALQISGEIQPHYDVLEKKSQEKNSVPHGMTKRAIWADKEAKSLGVGKLCYFDSSLNNYRQWEAFVLLYEMLEEYGTHLVEAAWNHQVTLLLQFCVSHENSMCTVGGNSHENQIEYSRETFSWLAILWQIGFWHDNPQVRVLIMQSFLGIEWSKYRGIARSVPESFVLGPFIHGLNDPVHHNDFGLKGIYASITIEGATRFMSQYTSYLIRRKGILFLHNLASVSKHQSFGRAGLMCLVECIASAACGLRANVDIETEWENDNTFGDAQEASLSNESPHLDMSDLLEAFRYVIESSKQHFNPNYRLQVCEKVLEAAAAVVSTLDVPVEVLFHFISSIPREFTDYGGSLRVRAQEWLLGCSKNFGTTIVCSVKIELLEKLHDFLERFTRCQSFFGNIVTYDDEDVNAWESEAKRWARVLFLVMREENEFYPILKFIQNCSVEICNQQYKQVSPVKFLLLTISLFTEMQRVNTQASPINGELSRVVLVILEGLISFADTCCSIFWSIAVVDTNLPGSVRGKLGGPSQRRLSSSTTTRVLEAITLMRAISSILSSSAQLKIDTQFDAAWTFLWDFFWKVVSSPSSDSETAAEICLAAYEALVPVLKTLKLTVSPLPLNLVRECLKLQPSPVEDKYMLDGLLLSLSQHIDNLIAGGGLTRGRRSVLLDCKWLCLESLLSIPRHALRNGLHVKDNNTFFSDAAVKSIFTGIIESLDKAGEGSVLPMLRSVRLTLELLASGKSSALVYSINGIDAQMMWHLVRSSWILHISSNKRRVACIAALLSSVLHTSIFAEKGMHFTDDGPGPLKWFVERVLEEGTKSPRTVRLAALHLTGLWLSHPWSIKYYMKELKLLTLHGSVAFDEDFEAELSDNHDARIEVSLLAKGPDPELAEAFINTELYARVCVAVLFYKLANLVGSANGFDNSFVALESGKFFLLELLDSVVNDKDLSKELYKKYSGIHRRKIRAWQMICVLSPFVGDDILQQVTNSLHISLQRNNLPGVRQYLETFAINIYLKFSSLVGEQLVPILRDYDMRPQALSSYVFIAANLILHASEVVRPRHLDNLLPPIVPLLTSHHHSLRGFTQLLVHQVFVKYFSPPDCEGCEVTPLEKRVLEDLRLYLAKNPDCTRLRTSMEGYLDAYDPLVSSTPAGIFINRVEDVEFECVPVSLMEEVLRFLNVVRDDLRCSMAKDIVTIKNESLKFEDDLNHFGRMLLQKDSSVDFQKKVTLSKHEKQDNNASVICGKREAFEEILEMEKEDDLLHQSLLSRSLTLGKIRASRQQLILVASLLDRIPNLAGLARTCEIFRTSGLTIADASILRDKQFQLISVTAEKWVPVIEVPVNSVKKFLEKKKREGFSILGLEQTANSVPLDQFTFPNKTVLVLGREKEGIPADIIHALDTCIEIPQLGVVRSLNVHVSGAIALWEYTRQQRSQHS